MEPIAIVLPLLFSGLIDIRRGLTKPIYYVEVIKQGRPSKYQTVQKEIYQHYL